jgi:hypothetical protein
MKSSLVCVLSFLLAACASAPDASPETGQDPGTLEAGRSTFHTTRLKATFRGEGALEYVTTLPGGARVYETQKQRVARERAAKTGQRPAAGSETLYYFKPAPEYPESVPHMILISKEEADVYVDPWIAAARRENERKAQEARLLEQQKEQERQLLQKKRQLEQARAEAELEKCLSTGSVGTCQIKTGAKSTYLCGGWGIQTGYILSPDCYHTDRSRIRVSLLARNNTPRPVKDVKFECAQVAKSGTVLRSTSNTIYDIWMPGEKKTVELELFRHEQVSQIQCKADKWAQ